MLPLCIKVAQICYINQQLCLVPTRVIIDNHYVMLTFRVKEPVQEDAMSREESL